MSLVVAGLLAAIPLGPSATPAATACGIVPIGCETWSTIQGEKLDDWAQDVLASPDGTRVFVTARQNSGTTPTAIAIMAHAAATGQLLWNTTYSEWNVPEAHDMTASPDGTRLHVAGMGFVGPFGRLTEAFLLTYDAATGDLIWIHHEPWDSSANAVTTSPDGAIVYLVGDLSKNYLVSALDAATGALLWTTGYDGAGGDAGTWRGKSYDEAFDITRSPDGAALFVTGISTASSGQLEYATLALDAANGATRWINRSHGTDTQGEPASSEAYSIRASPVGDRVFILGTAGVQALDAATGASLWPKQEDAVHCRPYWPMFNHECALEVAPDGGVIYAFSHNDLAAHDTQRGATIWHNVLRLGNDLHGMSRDMVVSPDGERLFLATPAGREDQVTDTCGCFAGVYETQAFDTADGLLRWRVTNGDGGQRVEGIDVSPQGDVVFVTGSAVVPGRYKESLTVAYPTKLGLDNLPSLSF